MPKSIKQKKILWERVFIVLGTLMLMFWAGHRLILKHSLKLSRSQVALLVTQSKTEVNLPAHIFIPWNTNADIEPLALQNNNWAISDTKVTYLVGSGIPGKGGNIVLYGHNKREILGNIRALKGGEKITLQTLSGQTFFYKVQTVKEVNPDDLTLLSPTNTEVLTLYTCSGIFDSKRFIVSAVPSR